MVAGFAISLPALITGFGYTLTGIGSLDAVGSLIIAALALREGREAMNKARGLACYCSCTGAGESAK